ncbi:MAG: hypothetical protein HOP30_14145 [Cyclobacteriaceae bacterium]|nr:hypothetical protein [Cyclobacteriaceae bacterium]
MYYILKPAVGTEETGNAYPAVESYPDYDFNAPSSVHKLSFHEFPDFNPDIRFKLAKGANVCDMMGQATINANGFLISEKLKDIFEKANIIPHKFYPATIEAKGTLHPYYWLHLVWDDGKKIIDFPNSVFYKQKFSNNLGYLKINSEADFVKTKSEIGSRFMIGFEKLRLKEQPSYDLMIVPFKTDIFISEKLKFQLSSLTGLEYEPLTYVKVTSLD